MTRQLLRQALDALEMVDGLDTDTESVTVDLAEVIDAITAALAQPEPSPVAEVVAKTDRWGGCWVRWSAIPIPGMKLYAAPPEPDTYRHPADDAALKRSFDVMESGIVAELRNELATIREQRDSYCKLLDAAVELARADRLDAQRYRQNRSTSCAAAHVSSKEYDANVDAAIDAAMTGGQP